MDRIWYIKNLDIFAGIPREEIMKLAGSAEDTRHVSRALLYSPHMHETRLFLVKEGEVSLYHTRDGKRFVFDVIGPGTLFGNVGFQDAPLSHFAEAVEGTRICAFSSHDFQRIIAAYPVIVMRALSTLGNRLEDYEKKLSETLVDAKGKILHEIQRYEKKRMPRFLERFSSAAAERRLTHERLAHLTGLNRVTVSRAIRDLQTEGKVGVDQDGKIIIHNVP
ncbi:Crp/Fnr family transcriptional regulator [Patescibacteria group bacterium]|nr:MAG: Crp/Fnr family transcriptional regulator [Patescibacteria group bacterium]